MTYEQLKEQLEEAGIEDHYEIDFIDIGNDEEIKSIYISIDEDAETFGVSE